MLEEAPSSTAGFSMRFAFISLEKVFKSVQTCTNVFKSGLRVGCRASFRDDFRDAKQFGWDVASQHDFEWKELIQKKVRLRALAFPLLPFGSEDARDLRSGDLAGKLVI